MLYLPVPKTHYAKDVVFKKDVAIFCTSKQPIIFIKNGVIDQRETDMMVEWWKIFHFKIMCEFCKKNERRLLHVQNVSLPLFYTEKILLNYFLMCFFFTFCSNS